MQEIIFDLFIIFLSVFVGLSALWPLMRAMTITERLKNAAIAGGASAIATFVIMTIAA